MRAHEQQTSDDDDENVDTVALRETLRNTENTRSHTNMNEDACKYRNFTKWQNITVAVRIRLHEPDIAYVYRPLVQIVAGFPVKCLF